jgi:MscS family membrane protein
MERRPRCAVLLLASLCLGAVPTPGVARSLETHPATMDDRLDEASPRAAVALFLDLARDQRWEEAGALLVVTAPHAGRGAELARRLKAVLDRHLRIDVGRLSGVAAGQLDDGLPADVEQVGEVPATPRAPGGPVRLVRRPDGRWAFGPATVGRIDAWYDALPDRWMRERIPASLLRMGPRGLLLWQWVALPFLVAAAWLLGRLFGWLTRAALGRLSARTAVRWDDLLLQRLAAPLTFGWALVAAWVLLELLGLYAPAQAFAGRVLRALSLFAVFWALWRVVDLASRGVRRLEWVAASPSAQSLLDIGGSVAKAGVLAMGVVAALSQLGYPVASLLAGLGIGGLAIALAAQKTVENLFGSVSLAADEPFRVGDFVKIEDFVGTVETIGPRSTRIRTLDRTLITLPNGRLADMRIENFTSRDRMRLATVLGLVYSTTSGQMRAVLEGVEAALRAHPRIWPDAVVVRLAAFSASSLDVEVMAWFQTSDWAEFQAIRQEMLLDILSVVERAGTSFAFPTQTVHLVPGHQDVARP